MHLKLNQSLAIRDKLNNDKTSSNEEMLNHFIEVIGIPERMAKDYLASRNVYLTHPAFNNKNLANDSNGNNGRVIP